ncbi:MAG: asparagine synthase (glutamine-hydrolyzing) [Lachnospiraceae bacterium]|nr:asparagine synthase (glutamine-hydrolyzing) [Lachnospiraceae bacterium]
MCGFAGFLGKCENKEQIVNEMMKRIVHRGPDSQESYVDDDVALGFVRLSIIDLSHGNQPMENEDGSMVLVFNGEIYNYQDIRKDLVAAGHVFKTNSDSEVLIHGYEEYGKDLLNKLRGMFAFTIWDKNKKKLFGARDFFGIKPYYYTKMGETFMFGSELKAFVPHPDFVMELNEERLPDYLTFGCLPGYDTMMKNVHKLPPAHYYEYENGQMTIKRYYQPEFNIDNSKSMEQFVDEIEDTFRKSVEAHKIADVEVGCFLSAGVDSSYVACELSKIQKVKTYTIGFDSFEQSEAGAAANLAKEIGVENYPKIIGSEEYFDSVKAVQYHLDEPLGNPSANNLYYVSKRAAEDLKVVLSGEGADEMFGGYNVYKEPLSVGKYQRMVPKFIRKGIGSVAAKLPDFKGRNFLIRGSKTVAERYIGNSYVFEVGERDEYLAKKYPSQPPQWFTKKFYDEAKDYDDVTKMQYMDIHGWMVQEILLKADKMSMSQSLELRVPFLDKEIFALSSTIPAKYKVSKENTKLALRAAANRQMNDYSANRKKAAFPTPLPQWLKEDKYYNLVKGYFTNETAKKYFNSEKLVELLDEHRSGKRFLTHKIWVIFSFLVWHEQYFDENGLAHRA